MNKEIAEMLQQLANKLGTTVHYLWSVLVSQAKVNAINMTIAALFCVAYLVFYIVQVRKYYKKEEYDRDDPNIIVIFGTIAAIGVCVGLVFISQEIITSAVNPEYWALDKILDKLK